MVAEQRGAKTPRVSAEILSTTFGGLVVTKLSDAVAAIPKTPSVPEAKSIERLTRRRQFLNVAKGKRCHTSAFTLQSAPSGSTAPTRGSRSRPVEATVLTPEASVVTSDPTCGTQPRFGITVTKKIGGAVMRNRIRRRLKEALRGLVPLPARLGHDYVIVARGEALGMPFPLLQESLAKALIRIDGASAKAGHAQSASDRLPHRHRPAQGTKDSQPRKDRTGEAPKA
jgi:ribonuclease P protein component